MCYCIMEDGWGGACAQVSWSGNWSDLVAEDMESNKPRFES